MDIEDCFTNIYINDTWNMGQNETKSGLGSTIQFTENIRTKLIDFIKEKNINNMIDTICGEWNWMKLIKNDLCNYIGIDIVKDIVDQNNKLYSNNKIKFIHTDFLTFIKNQNDCSVDLILCRHTLEHLPSEYNINFLNECKRVCKYLFVTGYNDNNKLNSELPESIYRPINLKLEPYLNILNSYYDSEFYDGDNIAYCPEYIINIYNFI